MCRAEMQVVGEQALQSLRIANDALEPLAPEPSKQPSRKSRRKKKRGESSPPMPSIPLDTAKATQASYEDEGAPDSSGRNASSDGIAASEDMKTAEERYAAIAESSSSRDAGPMHQSQNGCSPGQAKQSAERHAGSVGASSSKHAESGRSKHARGAAESSPAKITLKVMHDVAAAVQPDRSSAAGSSKNGKAVLNGTGQGLEFNPEPSSVPLRVAVDHTSENDDTAPESGTTIQASCQPLECDLGAGSACRHCVCRSSHGEHRPSLQRKLHTDNCSSYTTAQQMPPMFCTTSGE